MSHDSLPMRSNELALSMPEHALACNESVSKHRLECPCAEVLGVVVGIRHQHLFYEVMSAGQENALRTNAEARKRTVVAGCFEQEVEQVGARFGGCYRQS